MWSLATFVPVIALANRRLHDIGKSSWFQLLALSLIGIIPLIFWFCRVGTAGANSFGDNPLGVPLRDANAEPDAGI